MARQVSGWPIALLLSSASLSCRPHSVEIATLADLSEAPPPVSPAIEKPFLQPSAAATRASGLGTLAQPLPMRMAKQSSALYAIGAFPPRITELRPGPEDDRRLVEINCVGCHSTAYITMQPPLSRAAWEAEVQKMRNSFGAVIADPVASRIAAYLYSYYGAEK